MSKIQEALEKLQVGPKQRVANGPLKQSHPRASEVTAPIYERPTVELDERALADEGLLPAPRDRRAIYDQFREIKRPLVAHAFGRRAVQVPDGYIIMVTSAMANEGKTFTSVNLALSMAQERDYSVVLVDGDVVKPTISQVLGMAGDPGLLDVLEDSALDPQSVVAPTNVEGLSILPAGRLRPNGMELLASSRDG